MRVCSKCSAEKSDDAFRVYNRRGRAEVSTICIDCSRLYHQRHYANNREKIREQSRAWYQANSERRKEKSREWHRANTARHRELGYINRGKGYGFSPALSSELMVFQCGACAICHTKLAPGRTTHRDHDHETGEARGLLCPTCNTALGMYEKRQRKAGLVIGPYDDYLACPPAKRVAASIKG